LTPAAGQASVATNLRLADSGAVRVLAEMSDGTFLTAARDVRVTVAGCAAGGMADLGRVKLAVPASVRRGAVARLRALVLHPPERVGRQGGRSVERNYRFVNRVVVTYLGRDIVELEPSTAISENPTFTIPFRATETGWLKVTFFDTHGGRFEGTAEVKVT